MEGSLGDGGVNTVRPQLKHYIGDGGGYGDVPPGVDDAWLLNLFLGDLVSVGVKVAEVTGGERGDVRLKLPPACPTEGRVSHIVQQRELYQGGEPYWEELPHCSQ